MFRFALFVVMLTVSSAYLVATDALSFLLPVVIAAAEQVLR
jgi:hypothetical protein